MTRSTSAHVAPPCDVHGARATGRRARRASARGRRRGRRRRRRCRRRCGRRRARRAGGSCSCAKRTAVATSSASAQRAIAAGRLSIMPFQTRRAVVVVGVLGAITAPRQVLGEDGGGVDGRGRDGHGRALGSSASDSSSARRARTRVIMRTTGPFVPRQRSRARSPPPTRVRIVATPDSGASPVTGMFEVLRSVAPLIVPEEHAARADSPVRRRDRRRVRRGDQERQRPRRSPRTAPSTTSRRPTS